MSFVWDVWLLDKLRFSKVEQTHVSMSVYGKRVPSNHVLSILRSQSTICTDKPCHFRDRGCALRRTCRHRATGFGGFPFRLPSCWIWGLIDRIYYKSDLDPRWALNGFWSPFRKNCCLLPWFRWQTLAPQNYHLSLSTFQQFARKNQCQKVKRRGRKEYAY